MGFMEFGILCLLVLLIAWVLVWAFGYFVPGHPAIVDKIIWGVALVIIIMALIRAVGLHDVPIPKVH